MTGKDYSLRLKPREAIRHLYLYLRSLKTLLLAFVIFINSGCSIETDTKVSIINVDPLTFKLQGDGYLSRFAIYGPSKYKNPDEEEPPLIWELFPSRDSAHETVSSLSPIKYGETPIGWTQHTSNNLPLPTLAEGFIYRATANTNSANTGYIDFTIQKGKALILTKKPEFVDQTHHFAFYHSSARQ